MMKAELRAAAGALLLTSGATAQLQFVNGTEQADLLAVHTPQQAESMPWTTGGMGVGDFNRDGFPDLFVVNGGTAPDRLFINAGDGTFWEQALAWGLTAVHCGNAVAVADYDGDGWLDAYVTSMGDPDGPDQPGQNRLYRNTGRSSFVNVAEDAGVNVVSPTSPVVFGAAWGDYDLDGDLDLFVCTWQPFVSGNRLFRNEGDGTFTDVTGDAIGTAPLSNIHGFQPAFADMNGDLWPELLIASDFEGSRYFINNGDGTFTNFTVESGTGLDDNGMGQTVGDFDNDGLLDWYVTSIFNDFPPPGNNPGNMHYRNLGGHHYDEISVEVGDNDGGWGWGTIGLDLDNDGWMDIVEVNGRETVPPGQWTAEQAYLFHNDGDGTFTEMAFASGLDYAASGRCIAWMDSEMDGDLDVAIFTNAGPLQYYRNQSGSGPLPNHWLQVELDTAGHPLLAPDGFGTRLEATVNGQTQVRYIDGSPSYLGTSQLIAHFGLAGAARVDELRIVWSRGYETVLRNVAADQRLVVEAPPLGDVDGDGIVGVADLVDVILLWGDVEGSDRLRADLDNDGTVGVADLVTVILAWG